MITARTHSGLRDRVGSHGSLTSEVKAEAKRTNQMGGKSPWSPVQNCHQCHSLFLFLSHPVRLQRIQGPGDKFSPLALPNLDLTPESFKGKGGKNISHVGADSGTILTCLSFGGRFV